MKKLSKQILLILVCFGFIITISPKPLYNASETDDTECASIYKELEDEGIDTSDMTCAEAKLEYNYSNTDTKSFSKNIASGFLSTDPEVRAEETKEYYYKYFLESHLVPFASDIDDSLFEVDSLSNMVSTVITLFTNLIGLLNFITTTIIMFLLSLWQNGLITSIVDQLLVFINENILNIDSTTGSGMILIGAFALVLFIRNCFIYFKNGRPPVEYLKTLIVTLILIGLIPMSYTEIRPIMLNVTDDISEAITTVVFGETDKNSEVELKEQVFNAMTFDGFMYKNFGVVTQEDLEERDGNTSDEASLRIEGVLNSDTDVMQDELDTYDSKFLSIDISSSFSQFVTSLMWTSHSIVNMILLAIPLLLLIILDNVEQITWFFIWVPMVMMVFKMEEGYISSFLINRFQFLIGFTIINFILVILLRAQLMLTELIMGYNLGFLLVTDIIIAISFYLLWSIRDNVLAILRDLFKQVPAIAWGRTSTGAITNEFKPKFVELGKLAGEKLTLKNLKAEETEIPPLEPKPKEGPEEIEPDPVIEGEDELEGEEGTEGEEESEGELEGEEEVNPEDGGDSEGEGYPEEGEDREEEGYPEDGGDPEGEGYPEEEEDREEEGYPEDGGDREEEGYPEDGGDREEEGYPEDEESGSEEIEDTENFKSILDEYFSKENFDNNEQLKGDEDEE